MPTKEPSSRLSVLFFGTPQMSVATFARLCENPQFEVLGVVTQTDKPSGRGQKLQPSPIKAAALEKQIRVFQPTSLKKREKSDGLYDYLEAAPRPDFFVVVAYGKIIPKTLLDIPRHGAINIHFSLLPRWRGAAPVQRAVLSGDRETGIGIMKMDEGLDTGPVFISEPLPIREEDSSGSLAEALSLKGAILLEQCLPQIASGALTPIAQSETGTTYAEKLESSDFEIDWQKPARHIVSQIQAGTPFPGARSVYEGEMVKLFAAKVLPPLGHHGAIPGTLLDCNKREILLMAGDGHLVAVSELQFPNRKRLAVSEIIKSRELTPGSRFGV